MSPPDRHPARRRLGVGAAIVLTLAAAAVTVGIGVVRSATTPVQTVVPATSTTASPEVAALYVHVAGAVARPGIYRVDTGARVVDAVAAAAGFTDSADQSAVNLARAVTDGEQIIVPEIGAAPPVESGSTPSSGGLVDLNTADAGMLETLPRIGPALAGRIIAWRDENGRFTSVEDLLAVPGIGEKMLEALRDLVRV